MFIYLEKDFYLRLPGTVVDELSLRDGDLMECAVINGEIKLTPVTIKRKDPLKLPPDKSLVHPPLCTQSESIASANSACLLTAILSA